MGKRGKKWIIVYNAVMYLVVAAAMSISSILLQNQKLIFFPNLVMDIVISFVIAFLVSMILPVPKISVGFAGLLHIKPHTLREKLAGNIPVCLIFTVIVSGVLTLLNLFMAHHTELFWKTFPGSLLPMLGIMYVVTFIMTPIASSAANYACRK